MFINHSRRRFLSSVGLGLGSAAFARRSAGMAPVLEIEEKPGTSPVQDPYTSIDFRYSPLSWQTAFCFPDDPHKSLIGERGDLRYGHPGAGSKGDTYFSETVEFSALGMESDLVHSQRLESPGIPIIHTRIDRPAAYLELTTFATNLRNEGRVDNVIVEFFPRVKRTVQVDPRIVIRTAKEVTLRAAAGTCLVYVGREQPRLFMAVGSVSGVEPPDAADFGVGTALRFRGGAASGDRPLRYFVRLPQEGQDIERIRDGLATPVELLTAAREYWQNFNPIQAPVAWSLPERRGEFLAACAGNILQAREIKGGKTTFQVGPTVYRNLFVVDGNFLLEAARYLGYDAEAQQGLEATWARQDDNGGVFAGAGRMHWKDTGIALFTLARQAELSQDWTYFRQMQPQVLRAVKFLTDLRERGLAENSANGRYRLLARGFGDGGLGGVRSEFTNILWVLAGLRAISEAAGHTGLSGYGEINKFYGDLRSALLVAAKQEMRQHEGGFAYLPMLMKEDPAWSAPEKWDRPQPQIAQWALSHAIYPGLLFDQADPIVQGHIALMQACTQEDVPAETGWIAHEGLWTYNAAFVAEVYLWAGLADWARRTFIGFLNHATPLYCWREEQPLRGSLVAECGGDMPHNWASAECVRYLRHMLALEDGTRLRLLAGVGDPELSTLEPSRMAESPTRFGRVSMLLEPLDGHKGWRLVFSRRNGPGAERVELPQKLGWRFTFSTVKGAGFTREGNSILVSPQATSWEATWTS